MIEVRKGKGGFSMKLNKLLEVLGNDIIVSGDTDIDISALAYDSRKVEPGCLFVAIPGTQVDGHNYIQQAIDAGAVAIMLILGTSR